MGSLRLEGLGALAKQAAALGQDAKKAVKEMYKKEFMKSELPSIVKKMKLLDININDITETIQKELSAEEQVN